MNPRPSADRRQKGSRAWAALRPNHHRPMRAVPHDLVLTRPRRSAQWALAWAAEHSAQVRRAEASR